MNFETLQLRVQGMAQRTVNTRNADSKGLHVTIKDLDASGSDVRWDTKRLKENEIRALIYEFNGCYQAHLLWAAVSTRAPAVTYADTDKVDEANTLDVYAN